MRPLVIVPRVRYTGFGGGVASPRKRSFEPSPDFPAHTLAVADFLEKIWLPSVKHSIAMTF
jgi:hypothetical protein